MERGVGTVYLLHLDRPYKHARHYTGTATDLQARLTEPQAGDGARVLQATKGGRDQLDAGRTWPGGRSRERQLKRRAVPSALALNAASDLVFPADQRKDITAMRKPKDRSAQSEPGTRPPEYVVVTWVSEQLRDRIQRCGPSLDEILRTNTPERTSEPELEAEP
jgi:hypothetical protein